tara:strand:+ start:62 stop:361 length:300 start_codon:yes stop_codon:yes gene_type:complete
MKVSEMYVHQLYEYTDGNPNVESDQARLESDMAALEKVRGLALALERTIEEQRQRVASYNQTLDALEDFKRHLHDALDDSINVALLSADEFMRRVNEQR